MKSRGKRISFFSPYKSLRIAWKKIPMCKQPKNPNPNPSLPNQIKLNANSKGKCKISRTTRQTLPINLINPPKKSHRNLPPTHPSKSLIDPARVEKKEDRERERDRFLFLEKERKRNRPPSSFEIRRLPGNESNYLLIRESRQYGTFFFESCVGGKAFTVEEEGRPRDSMGFFPRRG